VILRLRHRPLWLGIGVLLIALVVWLSLTPRPVDVPPGGDKVGHFVAYATLMLWFSWIDARWPVRLGCAAAFVAMGIGLEFAQGATAYRSFEVADIAADTLGVGVGWLAAPPRSRNALALLDARMP
jgi:VanZ family protein